MPAPRLKPVPEQVIVITGATSGIGLATTRMAAEKGAAVVVAARNEEALNALVAEIRGKGGRAEAVVADVADLAQVERISETAIRVFGGFDSWCNNAAVAIYGELEDVPLEDQRRLFDVNYWGVVHGTLVASRHLKGKGGAIVNTGSILSDRAMTLQGPYSAAKFAVKAVTEAFRTEFEAEGYPISVTLIKPGSIDTPYTEHARNLLGSVGTKNPPPSYHPRVVARAILHACESRTRDLYVGGGGWAISAMGRLAPRLMDLVLERIARPSQTTDQAAPASRRDNLYEPKEDLAETSTLSGPPARKTSFLLEAQMNPLGPAGLLIGAAALLAGAGIGMYTLRRSKPKTLSDRAWRLGESATREARRGIGTLGKKANRLGGQAMDYAEHAEKKARPTLRQARKQAESLAKQARRYASSAYDDVADRGSDLYEAARDRGRSLYKDVRGRGEDLYDDASDRGWSLFKQARSEGRGAYRDARDRGRSFYRDARERGEDLYDDASDRGWHLFKQARSEGRGAYNARSRGEDLYDDASDRGWHLFKQARSEGRDAYKDTRGKGWNLLNWAVDRAHDLVEASSKRGAETVEEVQDRGWSLFGKARHVAKKKGQEAVHESEGLLDRINAALKKRL